MLKPSLFISSEQHPLGFRAEKFNTEMHLKRIWNSEFLVGVHVAHCANCSNDKKEFDLLIATASGVASQRETSWDLCGSISLSNLQSYRQNSLKAFGAKCFLASALVQNALRVSIGGSQSVAAKLPIRQIQNANIQKHFNLDTYENASYWEPIQTISERRYSNLFREFKKQIF